MAGKMTESRIEHFFIKEYKKLVQFVRKNMEMRYGDVSPEDIVQDVALSLLDKFNIDAQVENLTGYIYRSLRNKILDTQKRKRREVSIEDFVNKKNENELNYTLAAETDEVSILDEYDPQKLLDAIEKLSDNDKYIIKETHFDGKSFQQLSKELNVPIGTLLSRKHRAQTKLGKILQEPTQIDK
jgi:RNA polymerase sigma factor (sigma-70 family)